MILYNLQGALLCSQGVHLLSLSVGCALTKIGEMVVNFILPQLKTRKLQPNLCRGRYEDKRI